MRTDGIYTWTCTTGTCKCDPTAPFCGGPGKVVDLSGPINSANGGAAFTCPKNGTGNCKMRFDFLADLFPTGLTVSNCAFGECAASTDDPGDQDETVGATLGAGVIAGISVASVVGAGILGGLILSMITQRKLKRKPSPGVRKGVTITFKDVSYEMKKSRILNSVSGTAYAGTVTAIMGPSGAGKSTLLDILARKPKSGSVKATLTTNTPTPLSRSAFRRISGYVDQEDVLMPTLTVRETLMYSARFRLPESMSVDEKRARVEEVIDVLGLGAVADSYVGGQGQRGISGGERRRVSIGVELVTSPAVLFLDEPTSGLDSHNAHNIVTLLCSLAHTQHKTIIFTIHQPRSDVFGLFDNVLLLAQGNVLYSGPAKSAEQWAEDRGVPCPRGYNVADHLLDVAISGDVVGVKRDDEKKGESGELRRRGGGGVGGSDNSTRASSIPGAISPQESVAVAINENGGIGHVIVAAEEEDDGQYTVGGLTQLTVLLERSWKNLMRRPVLLGSHVGLSIVLGVFVGGLYFKSDTTLAGIQNRFGSTFFVLSLLGFAGLSAIGTMSRDRILFIREQSNGFYGPIPFYINKILFDAIPLRIIPAIIMGSIAFYMIGYTSTGSNFISFLLVISIFSVNCGLFCLAIGCAIKELGTANLVGSIALLFQMLFAGFLLNQDQIPAPLRWIQYLSLFRYAYESLVITDIAKLQISDTVSGAQVSIPASVVLAKFGFNVDAFARDVVVEVAYGVALLAIIFGFVFWGLKERR
ncbi:hypothetical protein HK104_002134 [Borealophlyctis nickersoniae]|nr:hypothetical protein HK104_002134 [Borealophlyctis nickersoniae]